MLLECAFIDTKDVQIIDTPDEQKKMGIAVAKGILKTLGIGYIPEETKPEPGPSGKLYRVQVGAYSDKANAESMKSRLVKAGYQAIIVEG